MRLLKTIPQAKGSEKLFPARGNPENGPSGFGKAHARIVKAMIEATGPSERWTLHDLRRTMATGLQRLGFRLELTEAVINHIGGSRGGLVGVYQRHDYKEEKRLALDAWAAEVERYGKQAGSRPSWER